MVSGVLVHSEIVQMCMSDRYVIGYRMYNRPCFFHTALGWAFLIVCSGHGLAHVWLVLDTPAFTPLTRAP